MDVLCFCLVNRSKCQSVLLFWMGLEKIIWSTSHSSEFYGNLMYSKYSLELGQNKITLLFILKWHRQEFSFDLICILSRLDAPGLHE